MTHSRKMTVRMTLIIAGALLVILVAFTCHSYRRDIAAARARVSSRSQVVSTPCGLIEYADVGKGPPVLAVHGAGGGFDQGLDLAEPLIDRGFRVIAMSRFGYLRTPIPVDASPIAQADAHACLLNALKLERVGVFAASAGAPSAMQLCLRHPERCSALVLLSPATFAPREARMAVPKPPALLMPVLKTAFRSDFSFWVATKLVRNTLVKTILGTPLEDFRKATPEEQAQVLQVMQHVLPIPQREAGLWNDATITPSLPRYDLERIRVPTLLISAEDDLYGTFPNARYTAEHIPGAKFVGFPTGGHLLLGHGKEVNAEVAEFLSRSSAEGHHDES